MPTPTYTPLATVTLGSTASSVTFSSIPATYRDLILVINGQMSGNGGLRFRYNADTGSNYSLVYMWATTAAQSDTATVSNLAVTQSSTLSGTRFYGSLNVMDYSATDKHTTTLVRSGYTNTGSVFVTEASAHRWANTDAITTIEAIPSANLFAAGTTINLFGVIA